LPLSLEALESRIVLTSLPAGFVETPVVTTGLSFPTAMEFAPDGRLFVAQQTGQLRVIKNGALLPTPFVSLTVDAQVERGLLGIAFDPDFGTGPGQNQYIYLYYTATTPTVHNRVSRFTANGDVVVPGSEVQLLNLPTLGAMNHNGGAIHFGPDGFLYIAVGENGVSSNAPLLTTPLGKMLRIAKDGTIPSTNPFFSQTTGINQAIWARGLRNPFTFDFNAQTGRIFINDVGQNTWEEINDGIAGANYGWPSTEGETAAVGITSPLLAYPHGGGDNAGIAIAGAAFYDSPTKQYPSDYNGDYFYADLGSNWIRRYDVATDSSTLFASSLTQGSPVDLKVDSAGALYYLVRGGTAGVYKITFPQGQTAPVITDQPDDATVAYGAAALFSFSFSAPGPATYQWRKGGVNIPGATGSSYLVQSATLADEGLYSVVVTDAFGSTTSANARLTVKSTVAGRHIFYNGSSFDLGDTSANAADDVAIATDKQPLFAGGTATFVNYTSYVRGINGIMVDLKGLRATPTAGDFTFRVGNDNTPAGWPVLVTPPSINLRPGAGDGRADRITLIWPDNTIRGQWLQITVKPTAGTTNLSSADVFYFGNAVGESGNSTLDARVTTFDELAARNSPHSIANPVGVTFPYDYNRDTHVSTLDQLISRNSRTTFETALKLIALPASLSASGLESGVGVADASATTVASPTGASQSLTPIADRIAVAIDRVADRVDASRTRVQAAVDAALSRSEELLPGYERIRRRLDRALDNAGDRLAELIARARERTR